MEPARPVLAAAVSTGALSAENVDIVAKCLDTLNRIPSITPEDLDRAEHDLTTHAGVLRPEDLRAAVTKMIECYDPDGQPDRDRKIEALRELRLVTHRDGSYSIAGRLTGVVGAQLHALLTPLARPRPAEPQKDTESAADSEETAPAAADSPTARRDRLRRAKADGIQDGRTFGQRWHDALADLLNRFAQSAQAGGLPASGGTPATVIVTISWENLLARTGHGVTTDGTPLSVAAILKLADEALILPTVLTSSGAILSQGRACRIATKAQSMALVARDGGCTFPGCDHPPEWCERHHIKAWIDGGLTDLNNLTLVCGYHHRSFDRNGWTCQMINGLPHWTPPAWNDPAQTPILHHRTSMRHQVARQHRSVTA